MFEPVLIDSETELQNNLFANCPKISFKLSRALNCKSCDFFNGIVKVSKAEEQSVSLRIMCGHPVSRALTEVDL